MNHIVQIGMNRIQSDIMVDGFEDCSIDIMVPAKLLDAFENDGVVTYNKVASLLNGFFNNCFSTI
jgi:hypothetical protein